MGTEINFLPKYDFWSLGFNSFSNPLTNFDPFRPHFYWVSDNFDHLRPAFDPVSTHAGSHSAIGFRPGVTQIPRLGLYNIIRVEEGVEADMCEAPAQAYTRWHIVLGPVFANGAQAKT